MSRRESVLEAAQQSPAVLCVFDVLVAETQDMRERSQLKRKEWLREHLPEIGPVRWLGHVHQHGTALFAEAVERDLEGIVAKRIGAPYTAGRHEHWIKKRTRTTRVRRRLVDELRALPPHVVNSSDTTSGSSPVPVCATSPILSGNRKPQRQETLRHRLRGTVRAL